MFHSYIAGLYGEQTYEFIILFFNLYPIWLPLMLGPIFWVVWMRYIRTAFFAGQQNTLLEIMLPADITRSPLSMELFLNTLHSSGGEATFFDVYWLGKTRAWFSLEIVSLGGQLHFYVWTRSFLRNLVESQIYAQFPDVEIKEVEDYTKAVNFVPGENNLWASNYILEKETLPIKTYIDYGLDKIPDAENTSDPLSGIIELLGSIKPNEQVWLQFVVRAHKKEKRNGFFSQKKSWATDIDDLRKKFLERVKAEGGRVYGQEDAKIMDALHRANQKFALDVGIRIIYFGVKDVNGAYTIGLRSLFRPFSANNVKDDTGFNNIKTKETTDFDYPWQDYMTVFLNRKRRHKMDAYKRRMFFYAPDKDQYSTMTTEALATMYHFPNASVAAPGLKRIQSKRAQAPTNLPV